MRNQRVYLFLKSVFSHLYFQIKKSQYTIQYIVNNIEIAPVKGTPRCSEGLQLLISRPPVNYKRGIRLHKSHAIFGHTEQLPRV